MINITDPKNKVKLSHVKYGDTFKLNSSHFIKSRINDNYFRSDRLYDKHLCVNLETGESHLLDKSTTVMTVEINAVVVRKECEDPLK